MSSHIAIFLPSLDGGGAERVVLLLAEHFTRMGHRCDLIIAMRQGQLLASVPTNVRLISLDKKKTTHAVSSLANYLRREKPDVLMATVFTANIAACMAHLLSGKHTRLVLREASLPRYDSIASTRAKTLFNRLSARFLYRRAAASIAISTGVKLNLVEEKLIAAERIQVISNPINVAYTPHDTNVDKHEPIIVACGRLAPQKDYQTLIEAFAKVRKNWNAKLIILGEGPLHVSLEASAKNLGVERHVTLAGYVDRPETYMCRATIFAHTARYEGFGVVFLEALAHGCTVVATDCPGGVRDILGDSQYGALVPVGNVTAIAQAIESILSGKLSFPSPEAHLRAFSLDRIAKRYLAVLLPDLYSSTLEP
jgi:glycosyltransferase involved in cell wall biosynthesis